VQELTEFEKHLLLLGVISTSVNESKMTSWKRKQKEKKHSRMRSFSYGHKRICRATFFYMYLMGIGQAKFTNIKRWYNDNGLVPRHKKSGEDTGFSSISSEV
jgi:hypothetical protein